METNTLLIMSNFKVICYLLNAEANASHSLVCFAVSVCLFAASHLAAAALWVLRVVVLLLGDQGLLTLFIIYLYNICENRQYNIVRTYDCRKTRQNNCIYGSPSTAYNSAVAPPSYCRTLLGGYILRVTHLVGLPSACCSDDQKCLKSCLALFSARSELERHMLSSRVSLCATSCVLQKTAKHSITVTTPHDSRDILVFWYQN